MVILDSLRRSAAKSFLSSIQNRLSRVYLFFGNINQPDTNIASGDNLDYVNYIRNNIFAIKEVLPSDICYVLPRVNYESGVEYLAYNSLSNSGSYVFNETNFSIYICVKRGNSVSTVTPAHTTTIPVTESDGYTWRYVYTVPLYLRDKFLTSQWLPVSNVLSESYFSNGGIGSVSILDSGEGYSANNTSIIVTDGSSSGSGAILSPVIENGKIVSIIIHESGYGYVSPNLLVSSPSSTRIASLYCSLSKKDIRSSQSLIQTLAIPGTLESIDIINGGSGYTSNVQIELQGDGTGASISFERNNSTGEITKIDLVESGENYTWARIVISDDNLVGGSGANFHVNVSNINGFGRNPLIDLNVTSVMIYQSFSRENLNGMPIENNMYCFGLLDSPKTITNGVYPKDFVTEGNFVTTLPSNQVSQYPVGTLIYDEYPITSNTKNFVIDEQIIGVKSSGIRIRALNGGSIVSGRRYYKDLTNSFVASFASYNLSVDRQMVSACFVLEGTGFDLEIFYAGKNLKKGMSSFVIVATSTNKILISALDGGSVNTGDTLLDDDSNSLTPTKITPPLFDKKTGSILTIEESSKAITYGPQQTVSFRTVINF